MRNGGRMLLQRRFLMDCRKYLELSRYLRHTRSVSKTRKTFGHGGARPGAGRKRILREPERITADFERADANALRSMAEERQTTVADLIRRAVSQYLRRAGRS